MVQILPGAEQTLGPALQQLAEGILDYAQPNRKFQKAMQAAIGTNPQLAQQLSDLEANAPGSLDRLGFGELGKTITRTPESAGSEFKRTNRDKLIGAEEQKLEATTAQTGFDLGRLNETITFLKDPQNKNINSDEILKRLTGQTAAERSTSESNSTTAAARAGVAGKVAKAEGVQADLTTKAGEQALGDLPNLKNYNFDQAARKYLTGRLDGATAAALFQTPGAGKAFETSIQNVQKEQAMALDRWLASHRGDNQQDNLLTNEAFKLYMQTHAGTLDAWKKVVSEPQTVQGLREMVSAGGELDQSGKDILEAADAMEQFQSASKAKQVGDLNRNIRDASLAIQSAVAKGAEPDAQQLLLANLNASLDHRAQVTGQEYQAKIGPRPEVGSAKKTFLGTWGEGAGLYFVDKAGNRVAPDQAFADVKDDKQRTADVTRTAATIQGKSPEEKAAAMTWLKANRPDIYDDVFSMVNAPVKK